MKALRARNCRLVARVVAGLERSRFWRRGGKGKGTITRAVLVSPPGTRQPHSQTVRRQLSASLHSREMTVSWYLLRVGSSQPSSIVNKRVSTSARGRAELLRVLSAAIKVGSHFNLVRPLQSCAGPTTAPHTSLSFGTMPAGSDRNSVLSPIVFPQRRDSTRKLHDGSLRTSSRAKILLKRTILHAIILRALSPSLCASTLHVDSTWSARVPVLHSKPAHPSEIITC